MHNQEDEVYLLFLEESREHLEDIESEILQLEEEKESADPELVNKIFRSVHTIKGGAGFFGIEKIQDLSHAMENLMGVLREGNIEVTKELISLLLDGADLLKKMVSSPTEIESIDIDGGKNALKAYYNKVVNKTDVESPADSDDNPQISKENVIVEIRCSNEDTLFSIEKQEFINAQRFEIGANHIYLLYFDLIEDIELKGKTPFGVISNISSLTYFIDSLLSPPEVYLDDPDDTQMVLPFYIICSTVMDKEMLCHFIELPETQVEQIFDKEIKDISQIPDKIYLPQNYDSKIPVLKNERITPQEITTIPDIEITPQIEDITPSEISSQKSNSQPVISNSEKESSANYSVTEKPHEKTTDTKSTTVIAKSSTIRISVNQLERLMNLAGELVLTRNELMQKVYNTQDKSFLETANKVDDITSEMQEAIMSTRMQSIGVVLSKFRRVVRDLSRKLHKRINLTIIGEDVELDRTIIEAIGDPLTHIVRNAIDHGIETPQKREDSGKNPIGTITITAEHRAGQVVISICDDGGGIDPERVKKKALENGVATESELEVMHKRDIYKLIFTPGFSTAEEVTNISGRGVGMDVVLSSLNEVGGTVDIDSEVGNGTTISISLPLTLAIMPSLLLESGGERFAIPQVHILELVRIKASQVKERIERLGDAAVLRLRGDLLPLVRLSDVLQMDSFYLDSDTGEMRPNRRENIADRRSRELGATTEDKEVLEDHRAHEDRRNAPSSLTHIAVVSSGNERYGIVVDSLLDSEEIVVKPLGYHLKDCKHFAGATILGDGQVALILDIDTIRNMAVLRSLSGIVEKEEEKEKLNQDLIPDAHQMLTLSYGKESLFAVPMDLVTRIEKIKADQIEKIGSRLGMKYRNDTLVLLKLEEALKTEELPTQDSYTVIVFELGGKEVGLLTSEVHDITLQEGELDGLTYVQPGILGTLILDNSITMVLDLFEIGRMLLPELLTHLIEKENEKRDEKTVLVVDDSPFFLKQLETIVTEAGYNCISAEDGCLALEKLKENSDLIDMVITDVEMPNMTGLELTKEIRADNSLSHLPIVACTTLSGIEAENAGRDAGVSEYLVKIDHEQILTTCKKYLHK